MKHFLPLLAAILLMPFFSFAQSNYKPGYVVTLKGDTVKGFIDYREWNMNPDEIDFKSSLTDKNNVKFGPNDIGYFNITGLESYVRYTGAISTDAVNNVSTDERDTSFRVATVFLKILEKGKTTALYSYTDELKQRFFVSEPPAFTPRELIYRVTRSGSENTYRKQLSAVAARNNELNDNLIVYIAKADYVAADLLQIVSKINHITKAEYNKKHYSGSSINFFAGAGININTNSPFTEGPYYTAGGRTFTSYKPAIFGGLNLFVNPVTKRLQMRIEFSVAQSNYKSLYKMTVYPYLPTEASFDETAVSVSPQIIYNFYNKENFKIFAGVGVAISSYHFSNSYLGTQNHDGSESDIAANNPYFFNTHENTFIFKTGVQFTKNLEFFADYVSGVATTQGGYFQLNSTCIQAGLIYLLNLK